jgi:methylated-DNA-[protein]-cysteine S-methyltransferase
MKSVWYYPFSIGEIGIAEENGVISRVFFNSDKVLTGFDVYETPLLKKAAAQLGMYFDGLRNTFDLPISLQGTDFQLSAWRALQKIPAGETRSYKDIAAQIGRPKAIRAIGTANGQNPIVVIIPCHRVIGRNGDLSGYVGGRAAKQYLLELERRYA